MPPLYEFDCKQCSAAFETIVKSFEEANERPPACPTCGSADDKRNNIPKRTDFQLKGRGWTGKINPKYHK